MNLKNNPPSGGQAFLIVLLILSFLGFLDATYLTILHFENAIPPCSISWGCETVLTSKFATIFGAPIALFGSLFYLLLISLSILLLTDFKRIFAKALILIVLSGVLVSAILIYIQFFILKTFCQYCLFSEGINFILVIFSFLLMRQKKIFK